MERWQKPEVENIGGAGNHPSRSSLDYNTPLRSVRGHAATAPSPFYKLSSELSRESLRIPGAVPFMWEQSPGRRKFTGASSSPSFVTPQILQSQHLVPEIISPLATDPVKPRLADLFRQQPSFASLVLDVVAPAAASLAVPSPIPQISLPPSADHPRSSSARYSVLQRSMPTAPFINNAALHDGDNDAISDTTSDTLTATAGGVSIDDNSLVLSGAMRLASTPSEARDFIMHRFLPAAHTLACDSPQMAPTSRRFLPPGVAGALTPGTPSHCNGSFRDYAVACAAASRPSPLRYTSASGTPALSTVQHGAGSFHGAEEEEEEEEEDVEEEPTSTPRACGIFPFHIHLSFHNRHSADQASRISFFSKHHHNKKQLQKKNRKTISCSQGTPTRIIDILNDDHSSSHDDESPVHRFRSQQLEAEIERIKIAFLERAGTTHNCSDPRMKPRPRFAANESYHPNLHQFSTAQQAASEVYNEEASEYSSYQDAPSRFQSPSPAALHLNNARALKRDKYIAQSTTSAAAGFQDDHPPAAIISTTEQHLLKSSFYYYNMHTSFNKPQFASPSSFHSPLSSLSKGSYDDTTTIKALERANDPDSSPNTDQWDAFSQSNSLEHKAHSIINNALYEHEDQQTNLNTANANCPSMFTAKSEHVATCSPTCKGFVNQGSASQAGGRGWHDSVESNINGDDCTVSNGDRYVSKGGDHYVSNGDHHELGKGDLHGGRGDYDVIRGDNYVIKNGDVYVSSGGHMQGEEDVGNDNYDVNRGESHHDDAVRNGDQYVGMNRDLQRRIRMGMPCCPSSLLSPPLPKSPTHSWLDRAIPLAASTSKTFSSTSSRLSHMHKATPALAHHDPAAPSITSKQSPAAASFADSKWEALVKGSHIQPGHLRFSKELFHQSQTTTMKVGAS